jgi:hypothetical protein
MAFPTAANITYRTFRNSALSVGRFSPSFDFAASIGSVSLSGETPTLDVGSNKGAGSTLLFFEPFDGQLSATGSSSNTLGWYDNVNSVTFSDDFASTNGEHREGTASFAYYFPAGNAAGSPSGGSIRRNIPPQDEVEVEFWYRQFPIFPTSSGEGTHATHFLTTLDGYVGFSYTHCTLYMECERDVLMMGVQNRAATPSRTWTVIGRGQTNLNDGNWHLLRFRWKMNTYNADGTPNSDAICQGWVNGNLEIDVSGFLLSTHHIPAGDPAPQFNQFAVAPYWQLPESNQDSWMMIDGLKVAIPGEEERAEPPPPPASATSRNDPNYDPPSSTSWFWVDNVNGDDNNAGTELAPWRNLDVAIRRLQPGQGLYVVEGTAYSVTADASFNSPAIQPSTSGTRDAPIIISARPGFVSKPIIRRTANSGPMLGTAGQDYIWYIDLEFDCGGTHSDGIALWGSTGSRIIRCHIYNAKGSDGGNLQLIRLENSTDCEVYGCDLHGVSNSAFSGNATCIKFYGSLRNRVSFCDMWDASFGIMDKGHESNPETPPSPYDDANKCGSYGNIYEFNRFRDSLRNGIGNLVQRSADFVNTTVRFNLFECYGSAIAGDNSDDSSRDGVYDYYYYNNTFYGYGNQGANPNGWGTNFSSYNNLYWAGASGNRIVPDIRTRALASDWEVFTNNGFRYSAYIIYGIYTDNGSYTDDGAVSANSLENLNGQTMFVSPSTGDYRLAAGSPAITAGTNGTYLGAFPDDSNVTTWAWW